MKKIIAITIKAITALCLICTSQLVRAQSCSVQNISQTNFYFQPSGATNTFQITLNGSCTPSFSCPNWIYIYNHGSFYSIECTGNTGAYRDSYITIRDRKSVV